MGVLKARVGGAWVPVSQGFDTSMVGYVGHAVATGPASGTNDFDLTGCSVAWSADPTHTYKTTLFLPYNSFNNAAAVYFKIADIASTDVKNAVRTVAAGSIHDVTITVVERGLSGPQTRKARFGASGTTVSFVFSSPYAPLILVEDITTVTPGQASLPVSTPWTAITLLNGWANTGTGAVGSDQVCQYRKVGDIVYVRGIMKRNAITFGQIAFTLPVGFRPPTLHRHNPVVMLDGTVVPTAARADMALNGDYTPWNVAGGQNNIGWWPVNFDFSVTA